MAWQLMACGIAEMAKMAGSAAAAAATMAKSVMARGVSGSGSMAKSNQRRRKRRGGMAGVIMARIVIMAKTVGEKYQKASGVAKAAA